MKPKKSLSLIVILSFLFITNLVMFSIIQRPLYAAGCEPGECDPTMDCEDMVWEYCDEACNITSSSCDSIEIEWNYCAVGTWHPCECYSIWSVNCTDETSYFTYCNEENTVQCPFGQK
jgi:hypothetical protein